MFRVIRLSFSLITFTVFVWFCFTVPLGSQTLFEHLRAIWSTREAQDLAAGTRQEAERLAKRVKDEIGARDLGSSKKSDESTKALRVPSPPLLRHTERPDERRPHR